MKKIRPILFIFLLIIIYIYVAYVTLFPNNIIIFEGESINLNRIYGVQIKEVGNLDSELLTNSKTMQAATNLTENKASQIGKTNISLNLFNSIPLKQVEVNVIKRTKVVPLGNAIGLKLYTKGVMVVGMSEVQGEDQNNYKPYENTGLKEGDMIVEIDDVTVTCISELIDTVNKSKGDKIEVKYVRDSDTKITNITPVKTSSSEYKLGLWVRDAQGGVGTASFFEPETGMFCALGHGITDVDTGEVVNIANGELVTTNIVSITKGEKGKPGEIKGSIETGEKIGDVSKNTSFGIYGTVSQKGKLGISSNDEVEVALRDEIKQGDAEIICELEDGKKENYKIQIQKVYISNNYDNKSMLIKITDERLLEKTGGIVQGMSGSPIMQNGKFVGSVTHVLVNDPTVGYGVFADMMIKQMKTT